MSPKGSQHGDRLILLASYCHHHVPPAGFEGTRAPPIRGIAYFTLIVLGMVLVILGIYPTPLMQLIERTLNGFG